MPKAPPYASVRGRFAYGTRGRSIGSRGHYL